MKLYMEPLAPNPSKVMLYIAEREAAGAALGLPPDPAEARMPAIASARPRAPCSSGDPPTQGPGEPISPARRPRGARSG